MRTGVEPLTVTLSDVCFLHWPVEESVVDSLVPDWLAPDVTDGSAWVSALPMEMSRFDVLDLPVREHVMALNLRTYVRSAGGDRGVYFLSLDATDRPAVETARRLFRLPYYDAEVERSTGGDRTAPSGGDRTTVRVTRRDRRRTTFAVTYEHGGPTQRASPDTLASFLTERYRYFATGPFGTRLVGSVGHEPWSLRSATASVADAELAEAVGVPDPDPDPLAHYSAGTRMRIGPPKPLPIAE